MKIRVGFGFDVHQLVAGRELWLGGIRLEHEKGLLGHSDADVLIHTICDALLGAANMRDIGYHFPDTAGEFKNIDSKILLKKTIELIATKGYSVGNIDATICAERPKLKAIYSLKCSVRLPPMMGIDEEPLHQGHHHGETRLYGQGGRYIRLCHCIDSEGIIISTQFNHPLI